MSGDSTVARPYAKAAFEVAQAQDAIAAWSKWLAGMREIVQRADIKLLAGHPHTTTQQLVSLLLTLNPPASSQMRQFVNVLGNHKRLRFLPNISAEYEKRVEEARNEVKVSLISALPLSQLMKTQLKAVLEKRLNATVVLEEEDDATLLGGIIIRSKDWIIDGSIRGKLAKLKETLGIPS